MQETIDKLKNFGNGAHAHTANKCSYYIEYAIKDKKPHVAEELAKLAESAMVTGDWSILKQRMSKWW